MKNAIFMTMQGEKAINDAYDEETQKVLREKLKFFDGFYDIDWLENRKNDLQQVDVLFSTWGMAELTEDQIGTYLPNLKAIFYAAGSVQYFAKPFLNCGVRVFSAFAANAVPVAEYVVAQIVLANKGFFQSALRYKQNGHPDSRAYAETMRGNYGERVGIIGAGMIGRLVIQKLKEYHLSVLVFDPFLPQEKADALGVKKCDLDTLFTQCQTISNHLANNDQTKGMLNYSLFSKMRENSIFLNTGRGAQVVEADLVRALKEVPTRTAVLDVTDPEPVKPNHPFYVMNNIFLTPHIAGSMNDEIARMGQYMDEEYEAFALGKPKKYEVTREMLKTMA